MLARRALIVDRDKNFVDRLRRCLQSLDFDLDVARSRREALEYLASGETAIVFLAVERPKKSGFKAFTEVKQRARNVPVVLASSTVPMAELLLHQKLRLHAEAYVDKRALGEQEILETLDDVLQLDLDPAELASLADQARAVEILADHSRRRSAEREGEIDESGEDALSVVDPALVALLGGVGASPTRAEPNDFDEEHEAEDEDEFVESDEVASLQDEVHRLENELAQAKRSASSSPFSTDYLALSEQAELEKRSNARLKREHSSRAKQVEALRAKLLQVADRLLRVERLRDQLIEQVRTLEAQGDQQLRESTQLKSAKDDLTLRLEEELKRREKVERQHAADLESFENRLAEQSLRVVEAEERHGRDLAAAEQSFLTSRVEAIEKERRRLDEDRQRMKREHEAAAAAQAEAANKEQAQAVEEQRRRHEEELQLIKFEYESAATAQAETRRMEQAAAAEEQRLRLDEERQRLRLEHEAAVKAQAEAWRMQQRTVVEEKDAEWQQKLDELRNLDERELNVRHEDHQRQLSELNASMEQAVRAKEQELATIRADVEAAEQLRERQSAQFEQTAREIREEQARVLQAADLEHDRRLEESRAEHARDLAARDEQHARQIDELNAAHRQALVERDRQHAEAVAQALADATHKHVRDTEERLDDFESSKLNHQTNLAKAEQLYKEQVELLEKLHVEQLDRQKIQLEREQDRMRAEQAAAIAELEHSFREEQELTIALKQAEWQTRLEEVREEQARALAVERGEMQVLIDALEAVKDVDRLETPAGETSAEPAAEGESIESSSSMLREIAEEMDRLGDSISDAAMDAVEPDPAIASTPVDPQADGSTRNAD